MVRRVLCISAISQLTLLYCRFFWGYSLTFGEGSAFIGNLKHFGLMNVLDVS